jgi:peptidoglycan/LPS O-acetylase OafA/YrhL
MKSIYFKNLYALRFIGAFAVILGHIELIKSFENIQNLMSLPFYKSTNGHIGVILFFVLSGFLITYFLLEELNTTGKINFKTFYIKRLLRIWPIYYLMVIFSVLIFPEILHVIDGSKEKIILKDSIYYWLFLPNIAKSLKHFIQGATHLWSIGVEEQFYLIWPILLLFFKKYIKILLCSIIIIFSLTTPFIDFLNVHSSFFKDNLSLKNILSSFFSGFKINAMAIGGIFAYINYSQKESMNFIKNDLSEIILVVITMYCWISGKTFGTYTDEIYSILFGIIIFIFTTRKNSFFNLENKIYIFFGKISYGLYVYHWVIILLLVKIMKNNSNVFYNEFINNLLLYSLSLILTTLFSYFSYKYIEKPIMKLYRNQNIL